MVGGENFESKSFSLIGGGRATPDIVRKNISGFKKNYLIFGRILPDKDQMEELGLPKVYSAYTGLCTGKRLDKCLASLYKVVASLPWLLQDGIGLICAIYENHRKGAHHDIENYFKKIQDVMSISESRIESFGEVRGDAVDKLIEILSALTDFYHAIKDLDDPGTRHGEFVTYAECAKNTAMYLCWMVKEL